MMIMQYIINHTVVFDPDNRILALKHGGKDVIRLSNPATRLLSEFINNNGTNLARSDILKRVWEDYGFSPSNANLNNHVSELRKAFLNLDMNKDVISTVPRIGLRMDADIHPEMTPINKITPPVQQISEPSETLSPEMIATHPSVISSQSKQQITTVFTTLSLLLALGIAVVTFFTYAQKDGVSFVITHKNCSISKFNDNNSDENHTANRVNDRENEEIKCIQQDVDIFYAETSSNMKHCRVVEP